eukprot:1152040-Karenia_brevis.AAC.1
MSRYLLRAVQNSRKIEEIDTTTFATPLESTLDMIEGHLDLREETNYTDVAKWRKVKERYEKGTLHYA